MIICKSIHEIQRNWLDKEEEGKYYCMLHCFNMFWQDYVNCFNVSLKDCTRYINMFLKYGVGWFNNVWIYCVGWVSRGNYGSWDWADWIGMNCVCLTEVFFKVYTAGYNLYANSGSYDKHTNQESKDHSNQSNDKFNVHLKKQVIR